MTLHVEKSQKAHYYICIDQTIVLWTPQPFLVYLSMFCYHGHICL